MRHVFTAMGTMVSVELADATPVRAIERIFADYNERFSLYRRDSELSRIAAGELPLAASSEWMRESYAEALAWRDSTRGAFTPHRPDGVIDLNGIVKAHAMRDAGRVLAATGSDWCLNVGGDVLVGGRNRDRPWTVGVVDPADRDALLCAVSVDGQRRAVATSGSAERGDHIWRRGTTASSAIVQATVLANDIVTADVLATAIVAGGQADLDFYTDNWPIDVAVAFANGELLATAGLRASLHTTASLP